MAGVGRSDEQLQVAAADGDAHAWSEIVDRYGRLIFWRARQIGASVPLAEDIMQVTFMKLVERLGADQPPIVSLKSWFSTVAKNLTINELKRAHNRNVGLDDAISAIVGAANPAQNVIDNEGVDALVTAWPDLSVRCQELLWHDYFEQLKNAQLAELLDIPVGSVSHHQRRCLAELAELIGWGTDA